MAGKADKADQAVYTPEKAGKAGQEKAEHVGRARKAE